jgi:hypothetical protein
MDAPGHPVFCMVDLFEDEKMENWKLKNGSFSFYDLYVWHQA